ncbi:hypothetical protein FFLO_05327 [Filobasidium floriforme]|uniref:F-box domain-containing protein n=1 Tax=Filobasidium floriforme TaxID=5210 RepID=A0A8K0JH38_9TREE|nr:hypothetical protein FFLO_05327 [Filobasidium floriforme]
MPPKTKKKSKPKPVIEPVYVPIFADIDDEEGTPYTLPPADQSEQLLPNEIMSHIFSFASKGTLGRCMETSQVHFELAVKRLYRKIKSYDMIYEPGPQGGGWRSLSNPLFQMQTKFRGCPGAAIRRDSYRRAVRSLMFNRDEDFGFAGQPAFDLLRERFPALSKLEWTEGLNDYSVRTEDQGSWSNLRLILSGPDEFSYNNGLSVVGRLTATLGIPLSRLDYNDPIQGYESLDDFIFKLAKYCQELRILSISPDEKTGEPPIECYRDLFPKTLEELDLPDALPYNVEAVLSWDLPHLRELTFELRPSSMEDLDWLEPKATRIPNCTSLQSVRFDGFAEYDFDFDEPPEAIDPGDMALWLSRTLPPQCRLAVSRTAIPNGEEDWARQVEERYLEQRQLEREESRSTAR